MVIYYVYRTELEVCQEKVDKTQRLRLAMRCGEHYLTTTWNQRINEFIYIPE